MGVAFVACAAAALGLAQPAFAQEAPPPPPPAESTSTSTEPTAPPPPADSTPADAHPSESPAATPPDSTAPAQQPAAETPAETTAQPASESPAGSSSSAPADTTSKPASESTPDVKDSVKLEPATPAAPAAPATPPASSAPAAPAAQPPAAPPPSAPAPVSIVLVAATPPAAQPAAPASAAPATTAAANAEAVAQVASAAIVSFRPRAAVALGFADEPAIRVVKHPAAASIPTKSRVVVQACSQPQGLVPLSVKCRFASVRAVTRGVLVYRKYSPSPEVRAAIDRGVLRVAAEQAKAQPPPGKKAAKEHPIPKIRPILPFGGSALGSVQDGFGSVAGSASSSRMFAIAAAPLRVPRPFRLARLRLPDRIAHGVLSAPPPARPG